MLLRPKCSSQAVRYNASQAQKRQEEMIQETVPPFWRIQVTRSGEETSSSFHHALPLPFNAYGREGLQEFLQFFLDHPTETAQSSPIELEIIRTSHVESFFQEQQS
jgi:hypothetical protein